METLGKMPVSIALCSMNLDLVALGLVMNLPALGHG